MEPDECYSLGQEKAIPDLAIEMMITKSRVNKLEIYRGLGVTEVWFWEEEDYICII
ncbi:hypothetical protein [Candidatus Cyanaurora vandensis]|uniref:hypothetical protein n=1 Tax=Candidatus Cyanaurora vandensis TaxID=2714958 RepID=UPI00258015D3|nr:hypothetical protein [Candidatus Cyanaurora vandensis]